MPKTVSRLSVLGRRAMPLPPPPEDVTVPRGVIRKQIGERDDRLPSSLQIGRG